MKIRFKSQDVQLAAVESVAGCFEGQPYMSSYMQHLGFADTASYSAEPFCGNSPFLIDLSHILSNVQKIQRNSGLMMSHSLSHFTVHDGNKAFSPASDSYMETALKASDVHIDVEMETGTGKTYCYIRTFYEMNRRFGWTKFIVVTPTIAIREGVYKHLQMTSEHFTGEYNTRAHYFIYNSSKLHDVERFSSDPGMCIMVINIQAFATRSKDSRRIHDMLDALQSRRPIDLISDTRPIIVMDEPQKMEGQATLDVLPLFNPLMIVRYSATHRTSHNLVFKLDALDAYRRKLVKRIAVKGIQSSSQSLGDGFIYLEGIDLRSRHPVAKVLLEQKQKSGLIKRKLMSVRFKDDLYDLSNKLDQYKSGYVVSEIDYRSGYIELVNGTILHTGDVVGDLGETEVRRIQIRETVRSHLEIERKLFARGIKVLSLFFIDKVVKYRDYNSADNMGEYSKFFEEEYTQIVDEVLKDAPAGDNNYLDFLKNIEVRQTHKGYFSIDKKTKLFKDSDMSKKDMESNDAYAYDLILRDMEKLLSFDEPTRFIFSHSALREGWNNPNIFVICILKENSSRVSRHQEIGRGLRLCIDKDGERIDSPSLVHEVNVLTVVASESYSAFVSALQAEFTDHMHDQPKVITRNSFVGASLAVSGGHFVVGNSMADTIMSYLMVNRYIDEVGYVTQHYFHEKETCILSRLPSELEMWHDQIYRLIDFVISGVVLPEIENSRQLRENPLNGNFEKREFRALWQRINKKAIYQVNFDSVELLNKCITVLSSDLNIPEPKYVVQSGVLDDDVSLSSISSGIGFTSSESRMLPGGNTYSRTKIDLIGLIANATQLKRTTIAEILERMERKPFLQLRNDPEKFVSETSRIIKEQMATTFIEDLKYEEIDDKYDIDIFSASQIGQNFSQATNRLRKHIYDYAIVDSNVEREFAHNLDMCSDVVVYAKLPRGFLIPTPVGDYNPDWAISFKKDNVRHTYFIAETKGSISSLQLRGVEEAKLDCARKFFAEINKKMSSGKVKFDVVTSFNGLMEIIGLR